MFPTQKKIRVLVVDDSAVARSFLTKGLAEYPNIEVVGYAINALDAIYRVTLTLHYQSGMSVQEIAEATGVSVKTAQKRLERARAKVLQEVEADDA